MPRLLNYPELIVDSPFEVEFFGLGYSAQYYSALVFINILGVIFLKLIFYLFKKDFFCRNPENSKQPLLSSRAFLIHGPYWIHLCMIFFPFIGILVALRFLGGIEYKLSLKLGGFFLLIAISTLQIFLIFSKRIFRNLIVQYHLEKDSNNLYRMGIVKKNLIQGMPLLLIAMSFVALVTYSEWNREKGSLLYKYYQKELEKVSKDLSPKESPEDYFSKINIREEEQEKGYTLFWVSTVGEIKTSDGAKLSEFFQKYLKEISPKNDYRIYDYYASLYEGTAIPVLINDSTYLLGIRYALSSTHFLFRFFFVLLLILGVNSGIQIYYSKSLVSDILVVSNKLRELCQEESMDYEKKIPSTSNDEMSDLILAFNKIMDKEKDNVNKILRNQNVLLEQERLVSLGNLIGGIAHNIRTPIMAISGAVEGLHELIKEYESSIGDINVSIEDHKEITDEMREWIEKIKNHCKYISDVITTVKGQATQVNTSQEGIFTVEELLKRVEILVQNDLKMYNSKLNILNNLQEECLLRGEISSMIQVINHFIQNAIHSYEEKGGEIIWRVDNNDRNVLFEIEDKGKGISKEQQEKLFKEMNTSKGKKGMGLGLYMSYATIIGKFGGHIRFESKEGEGTVFYISLPIFRA
jgi:signal transduction histidine kinase